jgi:hypothetical protein
MKTSVEWLTEKLRVEFGFVFSNNILEQAKEIEKQQIIDAFNLGQQKEAKQEFWTKGEQYYNENFKN